MGGLQPPSLELSSNGDESLVQLAPRRAPQWPRGVWSPRWVFGGPGQHPLDGVVNEFLPFSLPLGAVGSLGGGPDPQQPRAVTRVLRGLNFPHFFHFWLSAFLSQWVWHGLVHLGVLGAAPTLPVASMGGTPSFPGAKALPEHPREDKGRGWGGISASPGKFGRSRWWTRPGAARGVYFKGGCLFPRGGKTKPSIGTRFPTPSVPRVAKPGAAQERPAWSAAAAAAPGRGARHVRFNI